MLPIIVLAIIILFVVATFFYTYLKCINISDETARKIEIIGYVLLVCVIIWEFGLKNIDMNDSLVSESYYTVEKINHIYMLVEKLCNTLGIDTDITANFYSLKTSEYLDSQILALNAVEAILQILSTVFIAIGRLQELKNSKKYR